MRAAVSVAIRRLASVESIAHRVHLVGELADLVLLGEGEPLRQIAHADAPGLLDERVDRLADEGDADPERDEPADDREHDGRDGGAHDRLAHVFAAGLERLGDLERADPVLGDRHRHVREKSALAARVDDDRLLAARHPRELLAGRSRPMLRALRVHPDPADLQIVVRIVGVVDEGERSLLSLGLPDVLDGGSERVPHGVRVAAHVGLEERALAADAEVPVDREEREDRAQEREDELAGELHRFRVYPRQPRRARLPGAPAPFSGPSPWQGWSSRAPARERERPSRCVRSPWRARSASRPASPSRGPTRSGARPPAASRRTRSSGWRERRRC